MKTHYGLPALVALIAASTFIGCLGPDKCETYTAVDLRSLAGMPEVHDRRCVSTWGHVGAEQNWSGGSTYYFFHVEPRDDATFVTLAVHESKAVREEIEVRQQAHGRFFYWPDAHPSNPQKSVLTLDFVR